MALAMLEHDPLGWVRRRQAARWIKSLMCASPPATMTCATEGSGSCRKRVLGVCYGNPMQMEAGPAHGDGRDGTLQWPHRGLPRTKSENGDTPCRSRTRKADVASPRRPFALIFTLGDVVCSPSCASAAPLAPGPWRAGSAPRRSHGPAPIDVGSQSLKVHQGDTGRPPPPVRTSPHTAG